MQQENLKYFYLATCCFSQHFLPQKENVHFVQKNICIDLPIYLMLLIIILCTVRTMKHVQFVNEC